MKILKTFFITLCCLLAFSTGVKAEYFSDVILTGTQGIWIDARSYSSLSAAITAIGATDREIVIVSPQVVTSLTIPSNVRLKFLRNGSITNSAQLTINTKNISAEERQIFTGVGNIDFAPGSILKTGWFANFETALTLTTNDTVTLIVSKPATITADYYVGDNVNFKWEAPGNLLTVNAGITVSNIGNIEAGNFQLFAGAGDFHFQNGVSLNLSWFPYLRSALTWISGSSATIVVSGTHVVDYSDTVNSNITLDMDSQKGVFSISNGITLSIATSASIRAPPHQIFSGLGSVSFTSADSLPARWFGTPGQSTIVKALASIGTLNKGTLLLTPGTWNITSNISWSTYTNVTFKIESGALISHGVFTLNIPNPNVGIYQWLDGTGLVTFSGQIKEIYPQWYGALGNGAHDDYVALNSMFQSAGGLYNKVSRIVFPPGDYMVSDQISLPSLYRTKIEGLGSPTGVGSTAYEKQTVQIFATFTDSTKAVVLFNTDTENWFEVVWEGIGFNAARKAGYAARIIGSGSNGRIRFERCLFLGGTKFGFAVADDLGVPDTFPISWHRCWFVGSNVNLYVYGPIATGSFLDECIFYPALAGGGTKFTTKHIVAYQTFDLRINRVGFSDGLAPPAATIDPLTGNPILDGDIFCILIDGAGTVSLNEVWSEDPRLLWIANIGTADRNTVTLDKVVIHSNSAADGEGRNLNWGVGTAAYTIYADASVRLSINNSTLGAVTAGAAANRKYWINTETLNISNSQLGATGEIVFGTSNQNRLTIDGRSSNNLILNPNWDLSTWQSASVLYDKIDLIVGSGATATLAASTSYALYGKNTALVSISVAGTDKSGLKVTYRDPPHLYQLVVLGYMASDLTGSLRVTTDGATSIPTSPNVNAIYNTNRFMSTVDYVRNDAAASSIFSSFIGLTAIANIYYDAIAILPGTLEFPQAVALVKQQGSYRSSSVKREHFGTAAPSVGLWNDGDVIWNSAPAIGGPPGWVCTTGTGIDVGTWTAMPNL